MALEAALKVIPLPASAGDMDSLLRSYVFEIPGTVIRAIALRPEFLGRAGPGVAGPLGAQSGMVFAAATRASYPARVKWFQSIVWIRIPRLLQ